MSEKIKKFVSVIGGKMDITCDNCGGKMRPGGHYQMDVDDKSHQFCSEACMDTFESKA